MTETAKAEPAKKTEHIRIKPADLRVVPILIIGDSPLVIHAWGPKAIKMLRDKHAAGSAKSAGRTAKEPKDFEGLFQDARHRDAKEGWDGIHAGAFRNAAIAVCRVVEFTMTKAKLSLFIIEDGRSQSGTPLVRVYGGEPERMEAIARVDNGSPDVRVRPMWRKWWCLLKVQYDASQFSLEDVFNLIDRCGKQVGICEGRPFSKNSGGMGWGTFHVATEQEAKGVKLA